MLINSVRLTSRGAESNGPYVFVPRHARIVKLCVAGPSSAASRQSAYHLLLQDLHAAGGVFEALLEGVDGHACRRHTLQLALEVQNVRRAVREQLLRLLLLGLERA